MSADKQRIIDTVGAIQAATGEEAPQGDVLVRLLPPPASRDERRALTGMIDMLVPRLMARGGAPVTPVLQLTPPGWQCWSRREELDRVVDIFLDAFRAIAATGTLHGQRITWDLLARHGMQPASIGLINTAGRSLALWADGQLPNLGAQGAATMNLSLPWDIDELIDLRTAAEFYEHRLTNPPARVLFFRQLEQHATDEARCAAGIIYTSNRTGNGSSRQVEVALHQKRYRLEPAIAGGFAFRLEGPEAWVGLTYAGLRLVKDIDDVRASIAAVLKWLANLYRGTQFDRISPQKLVEAGIVSDDALPWLVILLAGQTPQIVIPAADADEVEFLLGDWLLHVSDASTFDDLVYAIGQIDEQQQVALLKSPPVRPLVELPPIEPKFAVKGPSPDDNIEIGEYIGSGAFGTVYVGKDRRFDRKVAIKIAKDTEAPMQIVLQHARALSCAHHPAIVRVHYTTHVIDPDHGIVVPALVMEYVGGKDLTEHLQAVSLSRVEVERYARTLIEAVGAIHTEQGAHGDLHAGNVRIEGGHLRLLDIYHRPSARYTSTETMETQQADDRRSVRNLIKSMIEASDLGPWNSPAGRAFEERARAHAVSFADLVAALDAALAS
jgi:hypothetical protein